MVLIQVERKKQMRSEWNGTWNGNVPVVFTMSRKPGKWGKYQEKRRRRGLGGYVTERGENKNEKKHKENQNKN
jgi:hypothetical protein